MIFLNIIDLVPIYYDSIRFLLSWVIPVFIWGSLKFIKSDNQNEKHNFRILNDENFKGSLIRWFGFRFMLIFRSIDCFTSKWIKNRLCAVYIMKILKWIWAKMRKKRRYQSGIHININLLKFDHSDVGDIVIFPT